MVGMFICDHCGAESRDEGSADTLATPWFHDRYLDHDLCNKCRNNWEPDGPMGKDERYVASLREPTQSEIHDAIRVRQLSVERAAAELGVSRWRLAKRMRKLGIETIRDSDGRIKSPPPSEVSGE